MVVIETHLHGITAIHSATQFPHAWSLLCTKSAGLPYRFMMDMNYSNCTPEFVSCICTENSKSLLIVSNRTQRYDDQNYRYRCLSHFYLDNEVPKCSYEFHQHHQCLLTNRKLYNLKQKCIWIDIFGEA